MSYSPTAPRLRIDVNDPTNQPLSESSRFAERAEQLGFAGVGMPDHPHTGRDVFVRLALAAQRTTRVALFPSVTNPVSRAPKMLATLGATLGELAPGRARLAISSGKAAVEYVEGTRAMAPEVARAVEMVRRTLAAEFASGPPVPVYINASSPKMLSAAGAAADGVYAMVGVDPEVVATAMDHVVTGNREAGRPSDSIAVALGLPVFMAESTAQAYESVAEYALGNLLTRSRVFSSVLRDRMPSLDGVSQVSDLSSEQLHHLINAMVIAGTPQEAASKVLSFAERMKARHFIARVELANQDPLRAIEVFSSALRSLGGEDVLDSND